MFVYRLGMGWGLCLMFVYRQGEIKIHIVRCLKNGLYLFLQWKYHFSDFFLFYPPCLYMIFMQSFLSTVQYLKMN